MARRIFPAVLGALLVALPSFAGDWPSAAEYDWPQPLGLGTPVEPEVYAAWDIDVTPDGQGLPEGSGTYAAGREFFLHHCAGCHSFDPVEAPSPDPGQPLFDPQNFPILAGATGNDWAAHPTTYKTPGSYWPYASTLFDYIRRAMPFPEPQSLSNQQVYDLAAFLLAENAILAKDEVLDRERFLEIEMPNADGFTSPDPRPDTHNTACMQDCEPVLVATSGAGSGSTPGDPQEVDSTEEPVRYPTDDADPTLNDLQPNEPIDLPFDVQLVEVDIGFDARSERGLQSFSAAVVREGENAGSWLIVGGRRNGLHKTSTTQPAFPRGGMNDRLWAIDPERRRVASVPLDGLPSLVRDALSAGNQQFVEQRWDDGTARLWINGGYGWSERAQDFSTFGLLIAVAVDPLVEAIFAYDGRPVPDLAGYFSWGTPAGGCQVFAGAGCIDENGQVLADATFDLVVTGGGMGVLGDAAEESLVLVLGQRFGGEYSYAYEEGGQPFLQEYTCQVASFPTPQPVWGESFDLGPISVLGHGGPDCPPGHQAGNADDPFHRRDLNTVASIHPTLTGFAPGVDALGGVFTGDFSGHLSPLRIGPDGVRLEAEAQQTFCQYSAPHIPLFDATSGSLHTLILGGMGARYCTEGETEAETPQCTETAKIVPPAFMADGTLLSWTVDGQFSQAFLRTPYQNANPDLSPTLLLGSNAEFLAQPDVPAYANGVLKLDELPGDEYSLVGHVFGGIVTDGEAPRNVLFRDGPSWSSTLAFEVRIRPRR